MNRINLRSRGIVLALALASLPVLANADTKTFDFFGTNGSDSLWAEVTFSLSGGILTITESNMASNVTTQSSLIGGLFFGIGDAGLTEASDVTLGSGSALFGGGGYADLGSGYHFGAINAADNALLGNIAGSVYGFRSVGYGMSSDDSKANFTAFGGSAVVLDGSDYNLTDAAGQLTNAFHLPLVGNTVVFSLHTTLNNLESLTQDNVEIQYGTALTDPTTGHPRVFTPEPVTMTLGMAGVGLFLRRRKARRNSA